MKNLFLAAIVLCIFAAAQCAAADDESVALTVYNDGNAIVRQRRTIEIPPDGRLRFEDVAATIDPTTVKFRSITDPEGTTVIEQNYEYDLVSADKLLQKYIDREIEVTAEDGTVYAGILMSYDREQIVLAVAPEGPLWIISRRDNVKTITCQSLPEGLITKPTLMWLLDSALGGRQEIEVAYNARQCSWKADYTALLNEKDTMLDLSGWVTLTNNTGKTYRDASLKLVAGEVHRVEERRVDRFYAGAYAMMAPAPAFEEKAFAEYHLYTLPRRTTIKDRQIKQIEFLTASAVPVAKKYLFDPSRGVRLGRSGPVMQDFSVGEKGKVQVYITFKNDQASNMGMPLPAGRVRLFKMDEGQMEFVGEDTIEHTPRDEEVEVLMGNAFDVTATRKRTDFQRGRGANWMQESFEITLANHKEEAIVVHARERLYRWTNWRILEASRDWEKLEAQTLEFKVELAPDEKEVFTYTVRYEW